MQKILIVGTGGVGGYLGAQLIRHTDTEVTFLARGEHLAAIRAKGLTVHDNDTTSAVHPHAATNDPTTLEAFDLILLTVKATALEATLPTLSTAVASHTIMLPLLNGVEHDITVRRYYPDAHVLDGHIYILSNLTAPGTLRRKGEVLRLVWGSPDGIDPETADHLTTLFDTAHIRHKYADDIRLAGWRKYLFIASFAVLTARYGMPMDQIYATHRNTLEILMQEIIAVAQAKKIALDETEFLSAMKQASRVTPGAKTSMQLDMEAGKPAEIEALCGYLIREGERLGVAVPAMKTLYQHLSLS